MTEIDVQDEIISIVPEQIQEVHRQVIEKSTAVWDSRLSSEIIFKEDFEEAFNPNNVKYKSKPHDVVFRCKYHFRYFVFKLLTLTFGPLVLVLLFWKKNIIQFLINVQIIGFQLQSIYYFMRFIINAIVISILCTIPFSWRLMSTYIYFFTINIIEATIGAIILAFYHPSKLEILENYELKLFPSQGETCVKLRNWITQTEELIDYEIKQSIARKQIETGQFFIFFLVEPNEKRRDKIQFHFRFSSRGYAGDCALIAKEIIQSYNSNQSYRIYAVIAIIMTLIRISILIILHSIHKIDYTDSELSLYVIVQILQNILIMFTNFILLMTFRDLERKVYSMNQLSHLISAQKVEEYEHKKLFPTSNLMCVLSLFSWYNLRKVLLDYGQQYNKRTQYVISFKILVITCLLGFALYLIINPQGLPTDDILILQVQLLFDCSLTCIMGGMILLQGARINSHFKIHKSLLRKNIFLYQQLNLGRYFKNDPLHHPQHYLFRRFQALLFEKLVKNFLNETDFVKYTQFVINAIESVYRDLEYEEEYEPFTVLGIAVTKKLVISLCSSFVAVIVTMAWTLYQNHKLI